jgi:NAD(P)-dependent dehydrogenase (short-subunit alcohol dehydrogenase family)
MANRWLRPARDAAPGFCGQRPVAELSAYAVARGAVDPLVKHLAAALGAKRIRVSAVAPRVI